MPRGMPVEKNLVLPEGYQENSREIAVLLGWFFLRHLGRIYRDFQGDFVLAIVLGEIAHHNICHYYSLGKPRNDGSIPPKRLTTNPAHLEPCNAFSLSEATGIPRETIRRKIQDLLQKGWIRKHSTGGYVIEPDLIKNFQELNLEIFQDFITTSDDLHRTMRQAGD